MLVGFWLDSPYVAKKEPESSFLVVLPGSKIAFSNNRAPLGLRTPGLDSPLCSKKRNPKVPF